MIDDENTPVTRVSTAGLNMADMAAEDLIQWLQQRQWTHAQDRPVGFLEKVLVWFGRIEAAHRGTVEQLKDVREKLRVVERENMKLRSQMRTT